MRGGIPIGRIAGISVRLHYSWFLIFALVTWALAFSYFPSSYPGWTSSTAVTAGVITSLLFFGSVLAHELMHSIVANRRGIPVHSITLFIFGGVSEMTQEPKAARDEFWMALAGPLTSLALGGIFWGVDSALTGTNPLMGPPAATIGLRVDATSFFIAAVAYWLGLINLYLGAFNLIPGFPLDGGRVLRSIIWGVSKNLRRSTKIASGIGRTFGFLFIGVGIIRVFQFDYFNGIWIALIGWFLENAATSSYRQMALEEMLRGHHASEIMTTDCTTIPRDITVEKLVNEYILASGRRCFPVTENGRIVGLVTMYNVRTIPRDRWSGTEAEQIMTPLAGLRTVSPEEDLSTVLQIMATGDVNQVPVVRDRDIIGMIGRDNLLSFINVRSELGP